MKNLTHGAIKLLFFLSILILLQACGENPGLWRNQQISPGKRDEFNKMNKDILQAFKSGSMDTLGFHLSKELLQDANINRRVELVSNQLKAADFELLDEYYIVKDTTNADSNFKITSPVKPNSYTLNSIVPPGENYIALFVQKTGVTKHIISINYFNYNYGWKVSDMEVGPYTVNGKTAPQLFELAKQEYGKHYVVNALNIMQMEQYCVKPIDAWQYPQEDEMNVFYAMLLNAGNSLYKFPLTLSQIPTHPRIFRVMNQYNDNGAYPMIYYLSTVKLQDTAAIKKENMAVKAIISKMMPGIDKDNKYLLYTIYNQMPNAERSVDHFDITEKIDQ